MQVSVEMNVTPYLVTAVVTITTAKSGTAEQLKRLENVSHRLATITCDISDMFLLLDSECARLR
jgi:hypothetical protein